MPDSFCETPEGLLLFANGMQRMLRWDGLASQAEPAGLSAPTKALTLTGNGAGPIVGDYFAYQRWVDKDGNFSNFSPVSNELIPISKTQAITNASQTTPVEITSVNHGLSTGTFVKVTGIGGFDGLNGKVWSISVTGPNTFTLDDSFSDGPYTGGGSWDAGVLGIDYANVEVPAEPRVVRRQILRNADGDTTTFYVDVDTTDLTATSLTGTKTDTQLVASQAQALLTSSGLPLANRFTPPPNHKGVLAHHLGRVFAAVDVVYSQGSVRVPNGAQAVQGIGTEWTAEMAGRFLYVVGSKASYQIDTVDTVNQQLSLVGTFTDPTVKYARYAIRPAPAERRLVYYSEAGLPEAWPAINAISVQEDGDELVGLMANGSFLYILEQRHIYRFTFQNDPAVDGYVFQSASGRGCVNHRCWAKVDGVAYMLDERGIHAFDGGEPENLSGPIQNLFRGGGIYAINWAAAHWFHALHAPTQETVRWFVALAGDYLPQHALCYQYRLKRWWIESYPRPVGSSVEASVEGKRCLLLGLDHKTIVKFWEGYLDGPDAQKGTVHGTATSAGRTSLTDSKAAFHSGLVNAPLAIVQGRGKGQTRRVVGVTATTLTIKDPWTTSPDTTSVYQVGGVRWLWQSGFFRHTPDEQENSRRLEVIFSPVVKPAILTARFFRDFMPDPIAWRTTYTSSQGDGVKSDKGSTDLEVDLTKKTGFAQKRLASHKDLYLDGKRYSAVELSGVTNAEEVQVSEVVLDGSTG